MSQQFCLKWNNHMPNMVDVFKNLLTTESMVDVTLACDGLSLKAHKIVLSACSSFFQSLFMENPCKHPIVILKDMKYNELKAIIEFMYHGEVNVAQDQLSGLMKTAEALKVKGLAETTGDKSSLNVQDDSNSKLSEVDTSFSKRKRYRVRKRRRSESDRSDEEAEPNAKQPSSPEIEELSDTSVDISGKCSNLQSQVPQVEKSICVEGNFVSEMKFTAENCKLLEQSLTDDLLSHKSNQQSVSLSVEAQKLSEITDSVLVSTSSQLDTSDQQPESPPDIKPTILELNTAMAHAAGSSHNACDSSVLNMEQSNLSHPGTSGHDSSQGIVSQSSSVTDGNLDWYVKTNLFDLQMKVNDVILELGGIMDAVNCSGVRNNDVHGLSVSFPFTSSSTLEDFDKKLASNVNLQRYLVKELSKLGGHSLKGITVALLNHLFTHSVAIEYSWFGAKGKKPFSKLQLSKIIQDVVRVHMENATNADIIKVIQNWLRHAKERLEYNAQRKNIYSA